MSHLAAYEGRVRGCCFPPEGSAVDTRKGDLISPWEENWSSLRAGRNWILELRFAPQCEHCLPGTPGIAAFHTGNSAGYSLNIGHTLLNAVALIPYSAFNLKKKTKNKKPANWLEVQFKSIS